MSLISPSGHKCFVPYVKDTPGFFFQFEIKELYIYTHVILKILVFHQLYVMSDTFIIKE